MALWKTVDEHDLISPYKILIGRDRFLYFMGENWCTECLHDFVYGYKNNS